MNCRARERVPTMEYSFLDAGLLSLRSQILEGSYRKTDLIRSNHELSNERDELRRRNLELEARVSEVEMVREEMKRDLEVFRERVREVEEETKNKSNIVSKIAESVQATEDRLSKSIQCLDGEIVQDGGRGKILGSEEYDSKLILELVKEFVEKVETFTELMEKKKMELSRNVEFLEEENRDINAFLRAALSEKQAAKKLLKEANEQKRSALLQIAERGLQRIGFGFGFRESVQESSKTGNLANDGEEEEEEEYNSLSIAIEMTIKNLRQETSQLKISLEESMLEKERMKKFTEEQAQELKENAVYINKLQNRESFLTQNVEELVEVIREMESEVSRWREACELEVEAGQREVEDRDHLIAVLKTEVEKLRSSLSISEGKLRRKEELAKAAMTAEEAAEKSLQLSERRIAELHNRIEQFYRQMDEVDSTERSRRKSRYVWCWPLWRLPTAAAAATASGDSSYTNNRALLRYDA